MWINTGVTTARFRVVDLVLALMPNASSVASLVALGQLHQNEVRMLTAKST